MIYYLLLTHFIGDFLLQSNWMALNKSKSWNALLSHTGLYALCFLPLGLRFALATFVLHTLTDAVTSRITSKLWFMERSLMGTNLWFFKRDNSRHWFFVVIGLDQLIHGITLLWTLKLLS